MTEKKCGRCQIPKPFSDFHKHVGRKYGVTEYCKSCRNIKIVSKRYNLTESQLLDLWKKHDNKCSICGKNKSEDKKGLAVDHCHTTGKIRGMLCGNCNNGIGRFKDSIDLLEKAAQYLKENK